MTLAMKNVFIISGPAGSGKDSIIDRLLVQLPAERVVTTTTRPPRAEEKEGSPYYFVSRKHFEQGIRDGLFAEYSINENDAYYGVTKAELGRFTHSKKIGLWRIDWKGVITAKRMFPKIIAIFIAAPLDVLEQRLRERDGAKQNEAYFKERMAYTKEWLSHTDIYDYTIKNTQGKLDEAVTKTRALIEQNITCS